MWTGEGVRFAFNSEATHVQYENHEFEVQVEHKNGFKQTLKGSHLLIAAGRLPNSDKIGADKIGLATASAATSRWMITCAPTSKGSTRSAT